MRNPIVTVARRFCRHGEREIREFERRLANLERSEARLRRLAGKSGKRILAAERRHDPAAAAVRAFEAVVRRGRRS